MQRSSCLQSLLLSTGALLSNEARLTQSTPCPVFAVTRPHDIPESLPGISCPPQPDPNIGAPKPQCFCSHSAFAHTFRTATWQHALQAWLAHHDPPAALQTQSSPIQRHRWSSNWIHSVKYTHNLVLNIQHSICSNRVLIMVGK